MLNANGECCQNLDHMDGDVMFASFSVLYSFTLTSHDVTVIKIIAFCTDCNALTVVRLRKQKRIHCLGFGNQLESNEKTTIPRIKF
ncbi:hypothetical protein OUZ56_018352 [Daphnia magna]|uniref:Uncharacterized protein n=1 Tax=Daphnia magna TaxID=35525 RepID=A0ABQ9Z8N5_9CRUS|nr:hypothetical protein OUZ56_018352 [Daphnia magna]